MKRKEVDDVMGGEGAWDNVDQTEAQCPNDACEGQRAYFYMVQIRSADEPMTTFFKVRFNYPKHRPTDIIYVNMSFKCTTCGHKWKEN
jgi:DNA-directed RNA polymerase III subunit RPC11